MPKYTVSIVMEETFLVEVEGPDMDEAQDVAMSAWLDSEDPWKQFRHACSKIEPTCVFDQEPIGMQERTAKILSLFPKKPN